MRTNIRGDVMKHLIYILFILITVNQLFAESKGSVLVLPIQTNLPEKQHAIYQESISKMIISQLIMENLETTNYNNSEKILSILKEKNISKSDLANLKIIDGLDYLLIGSFKKYNNEISLLLQLINANTGTTLFEDKQLIELNPNKNYDIFYKDKNKILLNQDKILNFFSNKSERKLNWTDFSIVEKIVHFIKLNSFLKKASNNIKNNELTDKINSLTSIIQEGRFSLYTWNQYLDLIRQLKNYTLSSTLQKSYDDAVLSLGLQKKKQIDIMFIMNSSLSMKDEILTLKQKMKNILEHFHTTNIDSNIRISITDFKSKNAKYRVNHLPFTKNLQSVENYLNNISKEKSNFEHNDLLYGLNYALSKADWSQHLEDKKVIFFLTDNAYHEVKSISHLNNLLVLPFQSYMDKSTYQNEIPLNKLDTLLIEKLKISQSSVQLDHGGHEYIDLYGYNPDLEIKTVQALYKKYHVQHYIQSEIEEKQSGYKLTVRLKNSKNNKTVFTINKVFDDYNYINHVINLVSKDLTRYFSSKTTNRSSYNYEEKHNNYNLKDIAEKASKKNIQIFVFGCSGIDKETESLLAAELADRTRGAYINIQYKYSALLSSQDITHFLFMNRELFQIKAEKMSFFDKGNKDRFNFLKDISLGKEIQTVELSKQYLLAEGFPIDSRFGFKNSKLSNNISILIKEIIDSNQSKKEMAFSTLNVDFGSYNLDIEANLNDTEKLIARGLIKEDAEVIFAVQVVPTELYSLKQNKIIKNNSYLPITKILKYKFHPVNMKILTPKWMQYIPDFLITSLDEINSNPYYYEDNGFAQNKVWFLKAKIKKIY